jgi:hypothetical protein
MASVRLEPELTRSLLAVQYVNDQQACLAALPPGINVSILGPSAIPGCVEIRCKNGHYHIFKRDLQTRSSAGLAKTEPQRILGDRASGPEPEVPQE